MAVPPRRVRAATLYLRHSLSDVYDTTTAARRAARRDGTRTRTCQDAMRLLVSKRFVEERPAEDEYEWHHVDGERNEGGEHHV